MESINVSLNIQSWNAILMILGTRPYTEVADIIEAIKQQAALQIAPQPAPSTNSPE